MKIYQFFLFTTISIGNCYGTEVNLMCSGVEGFYSDKAGSKKLTGKIEVIFDDTSKKLISVNRDRLFGCFESGADYSNSCDCQVTEASISCLAKSTNPKENFISTQTIKINRVTGVLSFGEVTSGKDFFISRSGDFDCQAYTTKKF
jgi:hypothetical protein